MDEQPKQRVRSSDAGLSWVMAPFKAAEDRIFEAAAIAKQSFSLAHFVWCALQESAQTANNGGLFEVRRGRLAKMGEVQLEAVDALLSAFANVGLIAEGRLTTFVERAPHRNGHFYKNKREDDTDLETNGPIDVAAAEAMDSPGRAPGVAQMASGDARRSPRPTESSGSSEVEEEIEVIPPVVVVARSRESTTTTDQEIFDRLSKINPAKLSAKVVKKAVPAIRGLVEEGCDLDLDVVFEVEKIAENLDNPLQNLSALIFLNQIRARRVKRLEAQNATSPRAGPVGRRSNKPQTGPELAVEFFDGKPDVRAAVFGSGAPRLN